MKASRGRDGGLLPYIAAFKLLKAALLIAAGVGALKLTSPGSAATVDRWLAHLTSPIAREMVQRGVNRALGLSPGKLAALGIGAWLYAALFLVEGIGLWLRRRWAEYLTIAATASFIPFELYELAKEVTTTRTSALVLNVAVVIYLCVRVWRARRG